MTVVFGKACNGNLQLQLVLYDLACYLHLSPTSIDNKQLWKRFAFFGETFIATVDDFSHGGVVVGAFDGFDIEFAVFFAVGFTIGEAYHGSYGEGTLDVGVVETLDVDG